MALTTQESERGDCVILALDGELDLDTAPILSSCLEEVLGRGDRRIVINASALTFCDSIGLSTLLAAHHACASAGGFLRLAAPDELLTRLLAVVGLQATIPVYPTVDSAVEDPAH
jgi:anti-sigma B factor antagonist